MLSKKTFFVVAIIITLSLLGTLLTVHIMQKNSKNSPEFALKKIAVAIEKRQLKTFTQYVDIQSLSESIL
ncbi:MAG: hypothetical protein VXY83_00995, partial [Pseudomonadota bacterium]|nr:hypothetical protein [Pseudomonadota bacterium]